MVSMSLEVELSIFGEHIPFIAERNCRTWPEYEPDKSKQKAADKWDALALLIEGHNDGTRRKIRKSTCTANRHRVPVVHIDHFYNRGDWADEQAFLVAPGVIEELEAEGFIEGTPHMGYTDTTELKLTNRGMEALVDHIKRLPAPKKK